MSTEGNCPCGSDARYEDCCGTFHSGAQNAPTAEALMRSRYCAFVKQLPDYLVATRHPEKRHLDSAAQLEQSFANTHWLGLKVLATDKGSAQDNRGHVSFAATYRNGDKEDTLFERSFFKKEGDRWFYVEGDSNIGRNDPCWCGSGKKYKKCHGR